MRGEHRSSVAQWKGTAVLTVGHIDRNWAVRCTMSVEDTKIGSDKTGQFTNLRFVSVHHQAYNSNKSPTRCNSFPVYYPDVYLQLNMFRAHSCPSSGAQWLQWQPLVLPSYRGDSRAVFVVGPADRPAQPRTQHDCHHDMKGKPEAATAVSELLMMGEKKARSMLSCKQTPG
jgi:hypothetical protein